MYEFFSERARQVFQLANEEARQHNHEYIGTEHVLLGLAGVADGMAAQLLKDLGIDLERIRCEVKNLVQDGLEKVAPTKLPLTPRTKRIVELSLEEARPLVLLNVDTEHILLGLLQDHEAVAAQVLMNLGLNLDQVRREVLRRLGREDVLVQVSPESKEYWISEHSSLRILDAAANRATEGLRVVEDFTRFVLDDGYLTRLVKEMRHDLAEVIATLPREDRHTMRETQQDVGAAISTPSETARADAWAVCEASCERAKQSLRSLEEYSKTIAPRTAACFEALRYRFYTLERSLSIRLRFRDELGAAKLCVLIDGSFTAEKVRHLIDAGVGMIQLREKNLNDRELMERARTLCEIAREPSREEPGRDDRAILVIVNDRADSAAAADADGVHLGQDDLPVKDARKILGPHKIIGVSTHSIEQARQAVLDGANYIGVGPTFPSATKQFDAFPGTAFLKRVAEETSLPAFAIGGITLENLNEVLATGIRRVAVSGAITKAVDPGEMAKEFVMQLD